MDPNRSAYLMGALLGGATIGALCGLIPLAVGRKRGRPQLGWAGFALCIPSGAILGLLAALPMAGVLSLAIAVVGPPARKPAKANRGPGIRTPRPESYDL